MEDYRKIRSLAGHIVRLRLKRRRKDIIGKLYVQSVPPSLNYPDGIHCRIVEIRQDAYYAVHFPPDLVKEISECSGCEEEKEKS